MKEGPPSTDEFGLEGLYSPGSGKRRVPQQSLGQRSSSLSSASFPTSMMKKTPSRLEAHFRAQVNLEDRSVTSLPASRRSSASLSPRKSQRRLVHNGSSMRSVQTEALPRRPGLEDERGLRKSASFRWLRKKTAPKSPRHDQIVADFFDVQSVTSYKSGGDMVDGKKRLGLFRSASKRSFRKKRNDDSITDAQSICSLHSDSSKSGTPRFLIRMSGDYSDSFSCSEYDDDDDDDDDDESTLGSSYLSPASPQGRNMDRSSSERFTSATRTALDNTPKKKKGFLKRLFGRKKKNKKNKKTEQSLDGQTSPTQEMDISLSSVDFTTEISQMTARYNQEMYSKSSGVSNDEKNEIELLYCERRERRASGPVDTDNNSYLSEAADDASDAGSVMSLLTGLLKTWSSERDMMRKGKQNNEEEKEEEIQFSPSDDSKVRGCFKRAKGCYLRANYNVVWSVVRVREYERTVGDNPACTSGPPISLGWAYHDDTPDEHVLVHSSKPKRSKREFHLQAAKRTDLLVREWEVPEMDIRKARREATYIQYCREKSAFTGRGAKEASFLRKAQQKQKKEEILSKTTTATTSIPQAELPRLTGSPTKMTNNEYVPPASAAPCLAPLMPTPPPAAATMINSFRIDC
jgi:hypothetical protein